MITPEGEAEVAGLLGPALVLDQVRIYQESWAETWVTTGVTQTPLVAYSLAQQA